MVTSVCLGLIVVAVERTQEYAAAFDGSLEEDMVVCAARRDDAWA